MSQLARFSLVLGQNKTIVDKKLKCHIVNQTCGSDAKWQLIGKLLQENETMADVPKRGRESFSAN